MKFNGAQLVVQALKTEGARHIFGVSGSPTLPILDVVYHEPQIRYIQSQHEQGAMYMANGYARAARTASICLVSPGAGITNCLSGVAQAYYTSTPSLLIAAEESTEFHGLGSSLHADLEAVPILKQITKLALRVERVERIAESLQTAFRTALSGRKGPVYVGIAKDILKEQTEAAVLTPQQYRVESAPQADPALISRAVDLLTAAERPVALVGGGLAWAAAQDLLLEIAELVGMPVATTRYSKGLISEDHPLALGTVGSSSMPLSSKMVREADVLLAVGCTFDEHTTIRFGYQVIPKEGKIIQVDIDPTELGKIYPLELGILGDAGGVLHDLLLEIKERKIDRRPAGQLPRIKEWQRLKQAWQASRLPQMTSDKVPIQRFRLLHDLRQALPRDAVVAGASGGTHQWFDFAFEALSYNFSIGCWGAIGSEYPESLGVQVALPERVVVCITGDGAMMMTLPEIATAVAYKIPLLCLVCHNGVFGNMRHTQITKFGGRFIGTDLPIPHLANIAREFGAYWERVQEPEEIIPAVRRALEAGRPSLLEVMIDNSLENLSPPPAAVDWRKDW